MLFNSIEFLIFFPLVVAVFFMIPHRYRWLWLLGASYWFYLAWKPIYGTLLALTTASTYVGGLIISRSRSAFHRKAALVATLVLNFGLLFFYKYYNFFNDSIRAVLESIGFAYNIPGLDILLPVGISFYTFQALSYTVDVYRGKEDAEPHLGIYALYISFFPQLVAGPIERSTRLKPQFYEEKSFDFVRARDGAKLMMWGFFKKLVIADRLAAYVETVYGAPADYSGGALLIATYFFAFQIYCDFSGYSDIAIGSAKFMGYDIMDNFRRPYFAVSVKDFWRRWHISLTTWFRDYVYIPLGGNRVQRARWYLNLLIVFFLSGLWHGAAWTFIVWGLLHGAYIIIGDITEPLRKKAAARAGLTAFPLAERLWKTFVTFNLVSLAWVFFRASSMEDAGIVLQGIFSANYDFSIGALKAGMFASEFIFCFMAIAFMETVHILQRHGEMKHFLTDKPIWVRWPVYYALIFGILAFGVMEKTAFIYFQF